MPCGGSSGHSDGIAPYPALLPALNGGVSAPEVFDERWRRLGRPGPRAGGGPGPGGSRAPGHPGVGRGADLRPRKAPAHPQADLQDGLDDPGRRDGGGRGDAVGGVPARGARGVRARGERWQAGLHGLPPPAPRPGGWRPVPVRLRRARPQAPERHRAAAGGDRRVPAGGTGRGPPAAPGPDPAARPCGVRGPRAGLPGGRAASPDCAVSWPSRAGPPGRRGQARTPACPAPGGHNPWTAAGPEGAAA